MNKRLQKRHKRQVSGAKERVRLSEPDLRTPEQLRAAREVSRPAGGRREFSFALHATQAAIEPAVSVASVVRNWNEFAVLLWERNRLRSPQIETILSLS